MESDQRSILTIVLFCLFFGIIFFLSYYFSRKQVVKRKLKKAAGKKISEFISGDIAKVVGKVEHVNELLTAPLSGRKCAYYYVLVEEKVSSGKSSHWKKLIEEEVSGSFVIRDGRNSAYVNSSKVKSYIVLDQKYASGFRENASETLEQYLNAHNIKSEGFLGLNKTLRYREGILEEGEWIAVWGRGEWKTASQLQLPDSFNRVLSITSTDKEPIYLSDDPETVKLDYEYLV